MARAPAPALRGSPFGAGGLQAAHKQHAGANGRFLACHLPMGTGGSGMHMGMYGVSEGEFFPRQMPSAEHTSGRGCIPKEKARCGVACSGHCDGQNSKSAMSAGDVGCWGCPPHCPGAYSPALSPGYDPGDFTQHPPMPPR